MPQLAGALTSLGLFALPAIPSPTYRLEQALTDTWSLTYALESASVVIAADIAGTDGWSLTLGTESAAVDVAVPASASDSWSTSWAEASALSYYPRELTQLSLFALPGAYGVVSAKAVASFSDINGVDVWLASWAEAPASLVEIDTWDAWALTGTLSVSLAISQTYAAADTWGLNWQDVGSVFAGGPIDVSRADTWSLAFSEAAAVAATIDASDTWSIQISDSGAVGVSSDEKLGTDSWALAFTLESAFFSPLVQIPIIASDEWRLSFDGPATTTKLSLSVPGKRLIRVDGPSRQTRVE